MITLVIALPALIKMSMLPMWINSVSILLFFKISVQVMQASGKDEPVSLAVFNCIFFSTSSHYIPCITLY